MALGGEMIADKLPFVPARTSPGGLVPRIGAAVYAVRASTKRPTVAAYALGAVAAIATATVATNVRRVVKERTRIPDFFIGLAEDALVAGLTYAIVRASD